jgi:hypothetical protein
MQRSSTVIDIYAWAEPDWSTVDLAGFEVEGLDGNLGTIDDRTYQVGADALVVSTGPWIFGKKFMMPAGLVTRIDEDDRAVFVNLTRDQLKEGPEFDESQWPDPAYRDRIGTHYTGLNRPAGPDYGKDDRPT